MGTTHDEINRKYILANYLKEKDINKIKYLENNLYKYKKDKYLILQYSEAYREVYRKETNKIIKKVYNKIPSEYHDYFDEDAVVRDIVEYGFSEYLDKEQQVRIQDYNNIRFYIFKQ